MRCAFALTLSPTNPISGIRNNTLSEKLLLDPRLTLHSAITQVRQSEAVRQQQPLLRGKPDTPVGAVNKSRGGITQGSKNNPGVSPTTSQKPHRCNWCGKIPSPGVQLEIKSAKIAIREAILKLSVKVLVNLSWNIIPTVWKFVGTVTLWDRTADTDVYVAKRLTKSLLGRSAILDLLLIKRIAAVDHSSQLSPKDEFPSL